jgi:AcrR family transcriptional regulator
MKRPYQLKQRAQRQAETRQRIVEAAVGLHTTVGPARTTISAIAERAGVERHTVYAHFPDDRTLFTACAGHWRAQHPQPDLQQQLGLADPAKRLSAVLTALYGWYAEVEPDVAVLRRDAEVVPASGEQMAVTATAIAQLGDTLARGFPRRKAVRAAIGHALEFETWRSLERRQGLTRRQAAEAMARLVAAS